MDISGAGHRQVGKWYWWAGGLAALLVFAVVVGALTSDREDAEAHPADEARFACEAWVRDELKAPSTAKFTDGTSTGTDGDWELTGEVEAENSFGAPLRTSWTCAARIDGDDWVGSVALD